MPQPDAVPPTEFRIWAFGKISTTKGEFLFDDAAGKSVLASFKQYGNRLTIDYEHMAVDPNRRAGDGKCAGSFLLELRADGLYAVDVRWTPPAAQALANREWLYFSPYFSAEEGTGRILDLINLALTNIPATRSMTPLVAAHRSFSMATAGSSNVSSASSSTTAAADDDPPPADRPPTDEEKKATAQRAAAERVARLRAELAAAEEECTALADGEDDDAGQPSSEEQETLDDDPDDAPPAATARLGRTAVGRVGAVGGVSKIAAAARAATGKRHPDQIVGALDAMGRTQGMLTALQRRIDELEAKSRRDEVTRLVATAVKQGKITPAEREWALSYGMESPDKLRGYLDVTPSRATVAGAELREPRRGAGGAVALSDIERRICENAGLDPEKYALAKQRPVRTAGGVR